MSSVSRCPSSAALPEPGAWQLPRRVLPLRLRAVAACVSLVPGGPADGAGVVPEDGADDFPVVRLKLVWPVHPCRLAVLLAEAAEVWRGPAGAAVRQAAHWVGPHRALAVLPPGGLDVAPRSGCGSGCCSPGSLGVSSGVPLTQIAQLLHDSAKVHVVMPHVKVVPVGQEGTLDSLHCCRLFGEKLRRVCACVGASSHLYTFSKRNNVWIPMAGGGSMARCSLEKEEKCDWKCVFFHLSSLTVAWHNGPNHQKNKTNRWINPQPPAFIRLTD